MTRLGSGLLDRGWVPDEALRWGIRRLLRQRLREERLRSARPGGSLSDWVERLRRAPIAPRPEVANRQHYEVPARFFELVLGPRLKYSCCLWPEGVADLAASEEAMLQLTAGRAGLADGQRVLDLGCGWGALSLWLAERHPASSILAISNSRAQGEWIQRTAAERGLANLRHRVADIGSLELDESFDRVVSIEMFEHLRNYEALLAKIARWLHPAGSLFVHVFCHRELTYPFEDHGPGDWMARHFFGDGLMPAAGLLPRFDRDLAIESHWAVPGSHYQRTCEVWLERLDTHAEEAQALFERVYGRGAGRRWVERWRIFFLACAELFGTAGGTEWMVAHYRFARRAD